MTPQPDDSVQRALDRINANLAASTSGLHNLSNTLFRIARDSGLSFDQAIDSLDTP